MEVNDFIEESFADDSIDELKNRVMQKEIKNALLLTEFQNSV